MAVSASNPPTTLRKTNHKTLFLYWEYLVEEWSNHWCKDIRMKQVQKLKTWWRAEGPKVLRWQLPWHRALLRSRSGFALQSPSAPVGDFCGATFRMSEICALSGAAAVCKYFSTRFATTQLEKNLWNQRFRGTKSDQSLTGRVLSQGLPTWVSLTHLLPQHPITQKHSLSW